MAKAAQVEFAPDLTEAECRHLRRLAAMVHGDSHFQAILNTVPHEQRRALYEQIKPLLSFKPKPFILYKFN